MKLKRLSATALAFLCLAGTLTGCTNSSEGDEASTSDGQTTQEDALATMEIQLNDYRGSIIRTLQLKDYVLAAVENMKTNNAILRTDNPNSFWTTDGYQDFVINFLSTDIINDSQWFNEEETTWETVVEQISTTDNSFTTYSSDGYALQSGIEIIRNEKDDYSVTGVPFSGTFSTDSTGLFEGNADYRFLYDCDKDWAKAYATMSLSSDVEDVTVSMFEYCRIDNDSFAIQTSRERLYVVFDSVDEDTDFRDRTIKEFYYSKLTQDGMRTTFTPYEALSEYDAETGSYDSEASSYNSAVQSYKIINDTGDIATVYGKNDSLFLSDDIAKEINSSWVFEDGSLQQAICYKDKALVVTTYNKLTEKYERFTYSAESVKDEDIDKLEELVSIEGLVGEQEIPEVKVPDVSKEDSSDSEEASSEAEEGSAADEASADDEEAINDETSDPSEGETAPQDGT